MVLLPYPVHTVHTGDLTPFGAVMYLIFALVISGFWCWFAVNLLIKADDHTDHIVGAFMLTVGLLFWVYLLGKLLGF